MKCANKGIFLTLFSIILVEITSRRQGTETTRASGISENVSPDRIFEGNVLYILAPDDPEYYEDFEIMNITVGNNEIRMDNNESHYFVEYTRVKRLFDSILPSIANFQKYYNEYYDDTSFKFNPNKKLLDKLEMKWGADSCRMLVDYVIPNRYATVPILNRILICLENIVSVLELEKKFIQFYNISIIETDFNKFSPPAVGQGFRTKIYSDDIDQVNDDYVRIGKDGLSVYYDSVSPGTLKFGFRFDIIEECKVDYGNKIVLHKPNPEVIIPDPLCCVNITLKWSSDYVTKNFFCSSTNHVYTCVAQAKVLQKGLSMGCLDSKAIAKDNSKKTKKKLSEIIGEKVAALLKAKELALNTGRPSSPEIKEQIKPNELLTKDKVEEPLKQNNLENSKGLNDDKSDILKGNKNEENIKNRVGDENYADKEIKPEGGKSKGNPSKDEEENKSAADHNSKSEPFPQSNSIGNSRGASSVMNPGKDNSKSNAEEANPLQNNIMNSADSEIRSETNSFGINSKENLGVGKPKSSPHEKSTIQGSLPVSEEKSTSMIGETNSSPVKNDEINNKATPLNQNLNADSTISKNIISENTSKPAQTTAPGRSKQPQKNPKDAAADQLSTGLIGNGENIENQENLKINSNSKIEKNSKSIKTEFVKTEPGSKTVQLQRPGSVKQTESILKDIGQVNLDIECEQNFRIIYKNRK